MNEVDWSKKPEWAIGIGYSHKHGDWQWFDHGHYMHYKGGVKFPFNSSFDMNDLVGVKLTCDKRTKINNENLPPVGSIRQMFMDGHLVGDQVLIMGYFDDLVWVTVQNWYDDGSYSGINQTFNINNIEFRPIKSDKEKWVDQAVEILSNEYTRATDSVKNRGYFEGSAVVIYDTLISGELPIPKGVKR